MTCLSPAVHLPRVVAPFLVVTAVLALAGPAAGAATPGLRLTEGPGGTLTVPVVVNGAGPLPFIVDTGSSHTALTAATARSLEVPRVAKTALGTAAGTEWAAVVRLETLRVGPLAADGVLATELPAGWLDGLGVAGVLGRDVLAAAPFTLDYATREISWPQGTTPPADALLLDATGPVWTIELPAGAGGLRLVPDSGAEAAVLFDRGQWQGLRYVGGTRTIESVTSLSRGRRAVLARLNLAATALVELPVVAVDGADIDRAHGDGLLPLHLFDRVTFWPRDGRVELVGSPRDRAVLPSFQ